MIYPIFSPRSSLELSVFHNINIYLFKEILGRLKIVNLYVLRWNDTLRKKRSNCVNIPVHLYDFNAQNNHFWLLFFIFLRSQTEILPLSLLFSKFCQLKEGIRMVQCNLPPPLLEKEIKVIFYTDTILSLSYGACCKVIFNT